MDQKQGVIVVAVAVGLTLVGFALAWWLALIGVVLLLLGVVLTAIQHLSNSPDQKPPAQPTPKGEDAFATLKSLVDLNLKLREAGVSQAVLTLAESVIDKLRYILPKLNQNHASHDLTWSANRLAGEYLPRKVIKPFLGLSPSDQAAKESEVIVSLKALDDELAKIDAIVRQQTVGKFEQASVFIKTRFAIS